MSPAQYVIDAFGGKYGTARLARGLGLQRQTVRLWTVPREKGGTGGLIPSKHFEAITLLAEVNGIELSPARLIGQEPAE